MYLLQGYTYIILCSASRPAREPRGQRVSHVRHLPAGNEVNGDATA